MSPPTTATILVVDDVPENLVALEAVLADDGVEVITARSGMEALEVLLVRDIAVALVDVQMPDMNGFELAELMRGTDRTRLVPIIFVTAGSRDRERLFRGYDAGAVDYLYKPVEPRILRNKVQVFLELWRQRHEITETLRLNEMFTAVLSHDLRNPLAAIVSGAEVVRGTATTELARRSAVRIASSAQRMNRMIGDLLDLTRVRLATGIPILRERVDLHEVAERVVAEQHTALPDAAIGVRAAGDLIGTWDGGRIGQVLSNLVGNAVRHGCPAGAAELTLDGTGDPVAIEVHNGGAIRPEVIPVLFDPFRRGPDLHAAPADSGLGLGLFIVREVARAHGGEVSVRSTADAGTTFRVTLPR
ncbi:MAG: hybrid sensor histidine kinase/response regulator [Myxococcota bacterium]